MASFRIAPSRGGAVVSMAVASGGERIAVGLGPEIQLVDAAGTVLARAATDGTSGTLPVTITASGAVVGGASNVVYVLEGGACRRIEGNFDASRSPIMALAEVAPGVVVTGHGDGALRRVDVVSGKFARIGYKAHDRRVHVVVRGNEPGTFFTGAEDRRVAEWLESERTPRRLYENVGTAFAIDVERRRALVQVGGGALALRSLTDGTTVALPARQLVPRGAFAADGSLAVSSDDAEVVVLDPRGALVARHRSTGTVDAVALDGSTLVVARGLSISTATLVSARPVLRREIRARHASAVSRLFPLPSGFASHASDGALKLWSPDGAFRGGVRLEAGTIDGAATTRHTLLVASSRGELWTLDATTHATLYRVDLGTTRAWSVAGPDDGSWIAGTNLGREAACFVRGKKRATWRRRIGRAQHLLWSEARRRFLLQDEMRVEVLDDHGKTLGEIAVGALWPHATLSPDGTRVACADPAGATVHALDAIGDAGQQLALPPGPDGARTGTLAWAGDGALWIARGEQALRVDLASGATTHTVQHAARITAMLDLGGPLAVGDERGEVVVHAR